MRTDRVFRRAAVRSFLVGLKSMASAEERGSLKLSGMTQEQWREAVIEGFLFACLQSYVIIDGARSGIRTRRIPVGGRQAGRQSSLHGRMPPASGPGDGPAVRLATRGVCSHNAKRHARLFHSFRPTRLPRSEGHLHRHHRRGGKQRARDCSPAVSPHALYPRPVLMRLP